MYRSFFKRFFDIIISLAAIILLMPVFLFLYALVKLDSKGPFFFFQERLGLNGSVFKVFKIRTMTNKQRGVHEEVFKGNTEVTRIGSVLRRFKVDEAPQLINVLIGDMSIIGPRPALTSQMAAFNDDGNIRLLVRPGLSGLAQVNGNIYLSWEQRWVYDRRYVENLSLLLDLKIIFKTIRLILVGEDKFIKTPEKNG